MSDQTLITEQEINRIEKLRKINELSYKILFSLAEIKKIKYSNFGKLADELAVLNNKILEESGNELLEISRALKGESGND
ncbi:MAG: hypothetical protein KDK54_19735 [Leptospiraceae bacterium]|nr:hypothetical protein [Leptospiraceae bacterium]